MKHFITCILLLSGASYGLHAQDKIVLRNGRTIEVLVQESLEDRVEYTYPDETSIYERPKSAISYILYSDGRKEVCDEKLGSSFTNRSSSPANRASSAGKRLSSNDEIFWQDVKTTFSESEVSRMSRLERISAVSRISYKDAIQQLKKKAAAVGGTTVLVMDVPENNTGNDIEVIGIAYRDKNLVYTPRSTGERNTVPDESSSNMRRRRIVQQMNDYHNDSNLEFSSNNNTRSSSSSAGRNQVSNNAQDAVYLMNGRVVRGTIEELEPDDFVSIRIPTGKVYEYSLDDVKRISRGSSLRNNDSRRAVSSPYDKENGSDSRRVVSSPYDKENGSNRYDQQRYNNRWDYDEYGVTGRYKGTFDAGYDFSVGGTGERGSFELNTSHGYQINEYLFAGAGIGLHIYNARDPKMKDPAYYPQYVGTRDVTSNLIKPADSVTYLRAVDSSYMTMPIFLDIRGYIPLPNSNIVPFAMLRFGYAFNLSDGFGGMGLYVNPAVGVKIQLSPMIGINFSIGYAFQNYGGVPGKNGDGGYGYYYVRNDLGTVYEAKGAGSISLKLGVEF